VRQFVDQVMSGQWRNKSEQRFLEDVDDSIDQSGFKYAKK